MVDVLVAHGFSLANDTKQRTEKFRPYSPLATLYAASILRETGFSVDLFDATLQEEAEAFCEYLEHCQPKVLAIYEDSFNFLSKMCLTHVRETTFRMIRVARKKDIPVLVSSSDATDDPHAYLSCGADFVMLGEAEHTICELANHLLRHGPLEVDMIPGVAYLDPKDTSSVIRTGRRCTERKLDRFPLPARDLLDIETYRTAWRKAHGMFSMNMVTTRGCPYACTWCSKPIWGKTYAVRSPGSVAHELAEIKKNYAPDYIWFGDDIFGLKPGWVESFAREVNQLNAVVPFMIQSRADLMDAKAVASLAEAGCQEVWIGAESGSQKMLDAMKKGITVEQIHNARNQLGEQGIRACFFIQLGYPGEMLEDIQATVQLVTTELPDDIGVSVSYPLPGTEFFDLVSPELRGKRHWQESNDLDMMFQGTFSTGYYRLLRNFLHRDLDTRLGRIGSGSPADIAAVNDEWTDLHSAAETHRNGAPTRLRVA